MHQLDLISCVHIAKRRSEPDRHLRDDLLQIGNDIVIDRIDRDLRHIRKESQQYDIGVVVDEGSDFMGRSVPALRYEILVWFDIFDQIVFLSDIEI